MKKSEMKKLLHSVVIPVYQSRLSLENLVKRVASVMNETGINFELVLVDDGSLDGSFPEIKRLASIYSFIRGFRLSRNFGHQATVTIGLQKCAGEFIAVIDDDLQDPPEILPAFFEHLYHGNDVVYGIREKRKENFLKRAVFAAFYRLISLLSHVRIPEDAGDFCAMRRCVVDAMLQMYDANPFLRGTRAWVGFRQIGYKYERDTRASGKSGYSFSKYLKLALSGIVMFSYTPLRVATFLGIIVSMLSFAYGFYTFISWLIKPFDVPGYLPFLLQLRFWAVFSLFLSVLSGIILGT